MLDIKNCKSIMRKLFQDYFYLDYNVFSDLLEEAIIKSYYKLGTVMSWNEKIIQKELDILVESYIIKSINNKDYSTIIKYANSLNYSDNYQDNMISFTSFSLFLDKYGICLDDQVYLDILDNSIVLTRIIKNILYSDLKEIQKHGLINTYDDEYLISIINIYASKYRLALSGEYINNDYVPDDTFKLYLNDIGKYPLLSRMDEQKYFKKIAEGDIKAKQYVMNCNQRLIVSYAKQYVSCGVDIQDLCQEANIDLSKAVDNFDITKGYKFSTYATDWIKRGLRRLTKTSSTIRISSNYYQEILKYRNKINDYVSTYHKDPTDEELANYMNEPLSKIEKYRYVENNIISITSLNELITQDGEGNTELEMFIEDSNVNVERDYEQQDLKHILNDILDNSDLNEREREVLLLHIAYKDKISRLEEIGKKYGVTRERVRQIEERALAKIIFNKDTDQLALYLDNPDDGLNALKEYRKSHKKPMSKRKKS